MIERVVRLTKLLSRHQITKLEALNGVAMSVKVEIEAAAVTLSHRVLRVVDESVKLPPGELRFRIALRPFGQIPIGVELQPVKPYDYDMRVLPGEPDECRIDRAGQRVGVEIGDGRAIRAIGDLRGPKRPAVRRRHDDWQRSGDVLDVRVAPEVRRPRDIARGVDRVEVARRGGRCTGGDERDEEERQTRDQNAVISW